MKQSEDKRRNSAVNQIRRESANGRTAAKRGGAASPSSQTPARRAAGASNAKKAPAAAAPKQQSANGTKAAPKRQSASAAKPAPKRTAAGAAKAAPKRTDVNGAKIEPKKPNPANRKPAPKKARRGLTLINIFLIMILLGCGAICAWRVSEYRHFSEMKAAVTTQDFYAGTRVDGVDVSNMTLAQAQDYFENEVEPKYRNVQVALDDDNIVTAQRLGYESNVQDVLNAAWNAGRTGTLEERYAQVTARGTNGADYPVARTPYRDDLVRAYVEAVRGSVDTEAVSASIASFNTETYEFEFAQERAGRKLDTEALVRDIENALSAGGGSVQMQITEIAPEQRASDIESQYGLIAYAVTNASSSSSNRLSNIKLALSLINGTCLEPGQTFSFNETVGKRTEARGFKVATAYSSGEVTEQVGGGICQVSTTLFNAVVKSDLKIDERHAHSLTVHYVDLGKDAAVDWGNKDLKFTNNTSDRIYICCYLTDDKRIRFGVFGKLLPNGETITIEGVQTGTVDYKTEYRLNLALPSGAQQVVQQGKVGYTATAYKIRWDANGNQISREELCKSRYKATDQIIEYGQ